MKAVTFVEPASLEEVIAAASAGGARLLAGGSDLLGELKEGTAACETLVSLAGISALRGIESRADGLRIGALTTIAEIEASSSLAGPYRILAEAARSVATPEIRNQGTLGGNLCQRPRCLHFRHALVSCLKKGGDNCPAAETPYQSYLSVFGGPGCYAVNASDLAPPLIAVDATASIEGPGGGRQIALEALYTGPESDPQRETVLEPGDVVTAVTVPELPGDWRGSYFKARERTAGDFPIVSLALGFALRDGRMTRVRLVLGGVAPVPRRVREAEAVLEGKEPGEAVAAEAASVALADAAPLQHNAFKLDLARALITRGVTRLAAG